MQESFDNSGHYRFREVISDAVQAELNDDGREREPDFEEDVPFDTDLYKFNEEQLINELQEYINSTYSAHYSKSKFQSTEFIIDCGHGQGFALGNVLKYVQRYGKKDGYNRADLMKVLHYALIALYNHDHEELNDEV